MGEGGECVNLKENLILQRIVHRGLSRIVTQSLTNLQSYLTE